MARMKPNSLAVFNANDIYPIGADSTMPFQQNRDLFYLSGVDQEEALLVLFPDAPKPEHREILFLTETNAHIAVWEGAKLTKEQATAVSGIETVYWLTDFDKVFFDFTLCPNKIFQGIHKMEKMLVRDILICRIFCFIRKFPSH